MIPIKKLPTIVAPSGEFVLRPFQYGDERNLVKHINSSHIADRVSNVPHPYTEKHAEDWIKRLEEERMLHHYRHRIDFAIDIAGEVVGSIAFIDINGHRAQLSYWLGATHQGKGIMVDAVKLVTEFGFVTCGFRRIWGYTYAGNPKSQRVLERAGFEFEGIHKGEWPKDGFDYDSHVYAIYRGTQRRSQE